jgi:hypothetical protein
VLTKEEEELPAAVHQAVVAGTLQMLSQGPPSSEELESELKNAVASLPDGSFGHGLVGVVPFQFGGFPAYVVGYSVGYCLMCSHTWLDIFVKRGEGYILADELDNPLPNSSIYFHVLPFSPVGGVRFLIYGVRYGQRENPLTIRAYSWPDRSQPMWSRKNVDNGEVEFTDDGFVLSYVQRKGINVVDRRTVYEVTQQGITCVAGCASQE